MILKSLDLKNIRSYTEDHIEFPLGTTLFEGDIGSGKSSILLAIEFALFGLGAERGASLLKVGASEGSVTLRFEVNGGGYEIHRSLVKKGRAVQQGEGYLKVGDEVLHLSPTELKAKALAILNFNEPPDPKAQSVIYRYAVYTPQEEMKSILFLKPDLRLQTLRKAFRIEDYRIAAENAGNLARVIEGKAVELGARASDLDQDRIRLTEKAGQLKVAGTRIDASAPEVGRLEAGLANLKEQVRILEQARVRLGRVIGEIPLLEKEIQEKGKERVDLEHDISELSAKIRGLEASLAELQAVVRPTEKSLSEVKDELRRLEIEERKLRRLEATIEAKLADYEAIEAGGICPTCDRPVDAREYRDRISSKRRQKEKASVEIAQVEARKQEVSLLVDRIQEHTRTEERHKDMNRTLEDAQSHLRRAEARLTVVVGVIARAKKQLRTAGDEFNQFEEVSRKRELLVQEEKVTEDVLRRTREELAYSRTEEASLKDAVAELQGVIARKEGWLKQAGFVREYADWLREFFIPSVNAIEIHALASINQDFNAQFQRWFSLLVEDPAKEARVDEDFTPLVEQDGYEQELAFLSGGEKTSVALAYRLALNTLVQQVAMGIKSNLLMLDEPTDGFSREQLFKVREILSELRCPQVILVSHESELEGFADHVYHVQKVDGNSRISK